MSWICTLTKLDQFVTDDAPSENSIKSSPPNGVSVYGQLEGSSSTQPIRIRSGLVRLRPSAWTLPMFSSKISANGGRSPDGSLRAPTECPRARR